MGTTEVPEGLSLEEEEEEYWERKERGSQSQG